MHMGLYEFIAHIFHIFIAHIFHIFIAHVYISVLQEKSGEQQLKTHIKTIKYRNNKLKIPIHIISTRSPTTHTADAIQRPSSFGVSPLRSVNECVIA